MIEELYRKHKYLNIHAITKQGGAGKSSENHEALTIEERVKFTFANTDKGISASALHVLDSSRSKFGPFGLMLKKGMVNNAYRGDGGSMYNPETCLRESTEGHCEPKLYQVIEEIRFSNSYCELCVHHFEIGSFFLDFHELAWLHVTLDGSLSNFYNYTKELNLPYYGFLDGLIFKIDPIYLAYNIWERVRQGVETNCQDLFK